MYVCMYVVLYYMSLKFQIKKRIKDMIESRDVTTLNRELPQLTQKEEKELTTIN